MDPKVWATGLWFAYLFPIAGFFIGLTQINKKGGTALVGASVLAGAGWALFSVLFLSVA